eukprot:TRINITY_DN28364_c0_g4_i3.p1 TRINITY_DN28364_c0_g4~~TRINITY_DN28364_c0_g4_i3.p1  ORF type:complete len:119 (-),score=2.40 TRINITY_DN28364_c0_g4_i3:124-480(-)
MLGLCCSCHVHTTSQECVRRGRLRESFNVTDTQDSHERIETQDKNSSNNLTPSLDRQWRLCLRLCLPSLLLLPALWPAARLRPEAAATLWPPMLASSPWGLGPPDVRPGRAIDTGKRT